MSRQGRDQDLLVQSRHSIVTIVNWVPTRSWLPADSQTFSTDRTELRSSSECTQLLVSVHWRTVTLEGSHGVTLHRRRTRGKNNFKLDESFKLTQCEGDGEAAPWCSGVSPACHRRGSVMHCNSFSLSVKSRRGSTYFPFQLLRISRHIC